VLLRVMAHLQEGMPDSLGHGGYLASLQPSPNSADERRHRRMPIPAGLGAGKLGFEIISLHVNHAQFGLSNERCNDDF
jgi:hypothetical protein